MKTAPLDGTVIEISTNEGTFRAFWFAPLKIWIDWDRQHVELYKRPMKGWRECVGFTQPKPRNDEEAAIIAERDAILLKVHG